MQISILRVQQLTVQTQVLLLQRSDEGQDGSSAVTLGASSMGPVLSVGRRLQAVSLCPLDEVVIYASLDVALIACANKRARNQMR